MHPQRKIARGPLGRFQSGSPYGSSEVIHDLVPKPEFEALERERHQIVNNFAVSASAGYELAPLPP
jgi:hypothetical protein